MSRNVKQSLSEPPGIDFGGDSPGPPQFRAIRDYITRTGRPITGNGFMTPAVTTPRLSDCTYPLVRGNDTGTTFLQGRELVKVVLVKVLSLSCNSRRSLDTYHGNDVKLTDCILRLN